MQQFIHCFIGSLIDCQLSCRRDERPIYFHRQLEGALNRVPYDFYDRVWHILERTPPGLKVAGYFLPQVCVQSVNQVPPLIHFCARQHICYSAHMLSSVRLSVCLSVTWVDQSKTVEVRIMQLSPLSSPMTLVSSWLIAPRNSKGNVASGYAKREG